MIRVSIEMPKQYNYRFKPLMDNQEKLLRCGVLIDYMLPAPDLRILHQDIALEEVESSKNRRLRTPTIVYERVDAAVVINDRRVRGLMQNEDVKLWLKRNTFRDYRMNNESFLLGQRHYMSLNDIPKFHVEAAKGDAPALELTEPMARKIRTLPIVGIERFEGLRNATIDWTEKRPIDVAFAGTVDDEVQRSDYWDAAYDEAQTASPTGFEALIDKHRRESVRRMIEMKHLRIVVGMNGAVQTDLYEKVILRSSISVSPWGLGEYAYRDYEAILAGSILVKPHSDHIMSFAPDIYQAGKYYVPCAIDFSDLHDVIREIMRDRGRAIEIARAAREDLIAANREDRVVDYFLGLFGEALGMPGLRNRDGLPSASTARPPRLGISIAPPTPVRGKLETCAKIPGGDKCFIFSDNAERNSHDIRLVRRDVWAPGLYRVRCILRRIGSRHLGMHVHHAWADGVAFGVDLDTGQVAEREPQGSGVSLLETPKVVFGMDRSVAVSAFVRIDRVIEGDIFLILYAAESNRQFYYEGSGEPCFEIAALDLDVVSAFGE